MLVSFPCTPGITKKSSILGDIFIRQQQAQEQLARKIHVSFQRSDACTAVYCRNRICPCGLKPENLMLSKKRDIQHAIIKVIIFGTAKTCQGAQVDKHLHTPLHCSTGPCALYQQPTCGKIRRSVKRGPAARSVDWATPIPVQR